MNKGQRTQSEPKGPKNKYRSYIYGVLRWVCLCAKHSRLNALQMASFSFLNNLILWIGLFHVTWKENTPLNRW